jgi:hypothetical protein
VKTVKKEDKMDIGIIFEGRATVQDLQELHDRKGYEFVLADGRVKEIIYPDGTVAYAAQESPHFYSDLKILY